MANLPQPTPVRLDPPGPYELSEAVGLPSLGGATGQLPIRLHFVLADGTELHLPISGIVLEQLSRALRGLLEAEDRIPGRPVRVHDVDEPPTFYWDWGLANVDFLHPDGTTTVLRIPASVLHATQDAIGKFLAEQKT